MVKLSKVNEHSLSPQYEKTELGVLIEYELNVREMSLGQFASLSGVDKSTLFRLVKGVQGRVHDLTLKKLAIALDQPETELRLRSRVPAALVPERLRQHLRASESAACTESVNPMILQRRLQDMIFRLVEMLVREPEKNERRILADITMKLNQIHFQAAFNEEDREFLGRIEQAYPFTKPSVP